MICLYWRMLWCPPTVASWKHPLTAVHHGGSPHWVRQGRSFHPTQATDALIVPGRASRVHLSQEEIQKLRFKPTVGKIQRSWGSEVKFNCSIDINDVSQAQDLNILWFRNGKEIPDGMQTHIYIQRTYILQSTLRWDDVLAAQKQPFNSDQFIVFTWRHTIIGTPTCRAKQAFPTLHARNFLPDL